MRQSWTDDRLDDLSRRMDQRFEQIDQRFERVDQRFEQVDQRFEQVDQRFDRVERQIDELRADNRTIITELSALQRTMLQVAGVLIGANLGVLAGIVGLITTRVL